MTTEDEYTKKAKEAEAMAASAINEDHRQAFLNIAKGWRELAAQRVARHSRRALDADPET